MEPAPPAELAATVFPETYTQKDNNLRAMADQSTSILSVFKNRALMVIASGHFVVDSYGGLLPVLFPMLMLRFDLDLATVGLVTLAYTGTSSLSQPAFGWIADRFGTRLTGIALIWTALTYSLIGLSTSFPLLLTLAALAGFGSGAFHPFGALNANAVINPNQRNISMSIYVTGGTIGFALGPLIGAGLVALFGLEGTLMLLLPGAVIGTWLLVQMRDVPEPTRRAPGQVIPAIPILMMSIVVAVMMLRMIPLIGVQTFIPVWYADLGYGPGFYGALATTVILGSAFGAIGAGTLADRYGTRSVLLAMLVFTVPAIWLFAEFPGEWAFLTGAIVGLLAGSTGPLLLVMAQQLMQGRAGVASGLILGLGFIAGGIGAPVFGATADAVGMQNALRLLTVVVVVTIFVTWFLPTDRQVEEIAQAPQPAENAAT